MNNSYITFYGGNLNDKILGQIKSVNIIYALDGDDEITTKGNYAQVFGGNGNDNIIIELSGAYGYYAGEAGNDKYSVTHNNSTFKNTTFYDIEGEDEYSLKDTGSYITVIDVDGAKSFTGVTDLSDYKIYGIDGFQNLDGYIEFTGNESKNITINDRDFQLQRRTSGQTHKVRRICYAYHCQETARNRRG